MKKSDLTALIKEIVQENFAAMRDPESFAGNDSDAHKQHLNDQQIERLWAALEKAAKAKDADLMRTLLKKLEQFNY